MLNVTNVARESQAGRKAVEGYIKILEDLLLGFKLDVFMKRARRELISHPKFYYFDCGVYRSLRPKGYMDKQTEIEGAAVESLIAQHLRAWCDYSKGKHRLYFWRTRAGVEVDFVIYGESGLFAFEVKNASKIKSEMLKGLQAFGEDYPDAQLFLLYRGVERLKVDNVLCCPCEEFLLNLKPDVSPALFG